MSGGFQLLAMLARRRWIIVGTVIGALLIGLAWVALIPPIYAAEAVLQIDDQGHPAIESQGRPSLDALVSGDAFLQTQYGLLRSRSLVESFAATLNLAADDTFIREMKATRGRLSRRDRVLELVSRGLAVVPVHGSRLVAVRFSSPNPALSARVANAFAEDFIAQTVARGVEAGAANSDLLARPLAATKAKLEGSERALAAYASQNQIIDIPGASGAGDPEAGPSIAAANLEALNADLMAARADRIAAEQRWNRAKAISGLGLADILQSPTIQALSQTRAQLAADYQDRLRVYKPDWPDMRQLKARLDETDRQIAVQASVIRSALHNTYAIALAREQALESEVDAAKAGVLDLRARSVRYTILRRDVETNRTLYDALLASYKVAGIQAGMAAGAISVIDRAEPPPRPSSPSPWLVLTSALALGLIVGLGLAWLVETIEGD
jgi:polysaccharide biosynthesis transport protein